MANGKKDYDVVIIGSGITGLSTAYHLRKAGIDHFIVLGERHNSETLKSPGLAMSGYLDNFTRFSHAHGKIAGGELWQFTRDAFQGLVAFCRAHHLNGFLRGPRLRLVTSDHELIEVEQAVSQLQDLGFPYELHRRGEAGSIDWSLWGSRVLAIQDEGGEGGYFEDINPLLDQLGSHSSTSSAAWGRVKRVEAVSGGVRILTENGTMTCEMVVLATNYGAREVLPEMKNVLVPYVDQWISLHGFKEELPPDWPGLVFSANHGLEWGVVCDQQTIRTGGARFLRPFAGTGSQEEKLDSRVTSFLRSQVAHEFVAGQMSSVAEERGGIGCRACDEIPLVGPTTIDDRILFAGGYMGSGLAFGFYAGQCLVDFIRHGTCDKVPDLMLARRLRSLPGS